MVEFKDGKYHGQGTFIDADGGNYVGGWKIHKKNGQGTSTFTDGSKYVGEFKDDKRNGQGTATFVDGSKYFGQWNDDERNGGPIYDENGNIIGVVVSQLNKLKVAKAIGSLPENVNFGIKASTVKQFLNASGLPSSWSKRTKKMTTKEIANIAENQTVMVVCHR